MTNLSVSLNAVAVVFTIIAIGYVTRLILKYKREDVQKINKLVYYILLPFMLFSNIYAAEFGEVVSARLALFVGIGLVVACGLSYLLFYFIEKDPKKKGVMIQAAFRSNYLILGLPLMHQLFPDNDLAIVSALTVIVSPLINVLAIVELESFRGTKVNFKEVFLNVLKSPLIIASLCGLAFRMTHIPLPTFIDQSISQVGATASAIGLIVLGAQFELKSLKSQIKQITLITLARLVIVPAIFLFAAYAMGFRGIEFAVLIPVFASPVAVASYSVATELGGDSDLAANAVAITTAISVATLFAWIFVFKSLGAF